MDWILLDDLVRRLVFQVHFAQNLNVQTCIILIKYKTIVMVELTCLCEENLDNQHMKKLDSYDKLKNDCEINGWKVFLFDVEVGPRGYVALSLGGQRSRR